MKKIEKRLSILAQKLAIFMPRKEEEKALWGFFIGAVYSLKQSIDLKYRPRSGKRLPKQYVTELRNIVLNMDKKNHKKNKPWLAGYFFNSALHRLAAVAERSRVYNKPALIIKIKARAGKKEPKKVGAIRRPVNDLKHEAIGLLECRKVGLRTAITAAEKIFSDIFRSGK